MSLQTINVPKRIATLQEFVITCTKNTRSVYTGDQILEGMINAKNISIREFEFKFLNGEYYRVGTKTIRQSTNVSSSLIHDLIKIMNGNYIAV